MSRGVLQYTEKGFDVMKRFGIMILILITLSACSNHPTSVEPSAEYLPSPTAVPSVERLPPLPSPSSAPTIQPLSEVARDPGASLDARDKEAYKSVLINELDFYSTQLEKMISLKDYCTEECTVDDFEKYYAFTVVDMDGDGGVEVILYIGPPGVNLVFHYEDGIVYGYSFGEKETQNIRTDGSFELDGSHWAICALVFHKETYEYKEVAYSKSESSQEAHVFYVDDIKVTENEYNAFCSEHYEKGMATWYELNDESMSIFGVNGE